MVVSLKQNLKQFRPGRAAIYCETLVANQWLGTRWALSRKRRISQRRLSSFREKHRDQRCFIIGNGPSLNKTDLSKLRNEITFGLNRIYLLFNKLGFSTTYLMSVNHLVLEQCQDEILELPIPKFISWRAIHRYPMADNTIFIRTSGDIGFSFDPHASLYESGTVTHVALQMAYFMGFQEVILIGVDHNFITKGPANQAVQSQGPDPNHFDPNYFPKGFRWHLPNLEGSEGGYRLAKKVFEDDGRLVMDATVGGKLQVFPKVDYESLF